MSIPDESAQISAGDSVEIDVPPFAEVTPSKRPTEERREIWRGWLALLLMGLLSLLAIGLVVVTVWFVRPFTMQAASLLIAGIFGPIIGLVGTVVGFYFGQESVSQRDESGSGATGLRSHRQR
ncbi:MAG TPA: hypothetical protein VGI66_02250 [Streptosporangiaceae bacterium]|jgi:hypothetical protein